MLVDFWTYTCINCIRTLPFLKGLYATYHRYGLEIVGVESPEFTFEQDASNVQQAINSDGLRYPVVQDNNLGTWNAYQNQYWPAEYLIDAQGNVRHTQFGEGELQARTRPPSAQLLFEAGARNLPPPMTAHAIVPSASAATPETYLEPDQRAQGVRPAASGRASTATPGASDLALNEFALHGHLEHRLGVRHPGRSPAPRSRPACQAANVYLVMTSAGNAPRTGRVLLDGKPIPAADAGADVKPDGTFTVTGQRLYSLVSLPARPAARRHRRAAGRRQRLRLHVRLGDRSRSVCRRRSSRAAAWSSCIGRVDVEQLVAVGHLEALWPRSPQPPCAAGSGLRRPGGEADRAPPAGSSRAAAVSRDPTPASTAGASPGSSLLSARSSSGVIERQVAGADDHRPPLGQGQRVDDPHQRVMRRFRLDPDGDPGDVGKLGGGLAMIRHVRHRQGQRLQRIGDQRLAGQEHRRLLPPHAPPAATGQHHPDRLVRSRHQHPSRLSLTT